jgi:hypothetical protein
LKNLGFIGFSNQHRFSVPQPFLCLLQKGDIIKAKRLRTRFSTRSNFLTNFAGTLSNPEAFFRRASEAASGNRLALGGSPA